MNRCGPEERSIGSAADAQIPITPARAASRSMANMGNPPHPKSSPKMAALSMRKRSMMAAPSSKPRSLSPFHVTSVRY